jgi:Flp pilus assembly protein TadG
MVFMARQDRTHMQPAIPADERGQAVVEFALSLSLLLLLLVTALDFGRAFFYYIDLVNAAREGARQAVIAGGTAGVQSTVLQEVLDNGLDLARLGVTSSWGGSSGNSVPGNSVVVNVSYNYPLISQHILPFTSLTLRATATMRIP